MNPKKLFLTLSLLLLTLVSCENGGNGFPNNGQPVTTAIFTVPSGTALLADNTTAYSFNITVDQVNGTIGFGEFTAVLNSPTGTVDIAGLAIVFDSFTQTDFNSVSVRGTVTGPFVGQGTVNVTLTYTEYGIRILENSVTFTVTIAGPTEFSVCDLTLFPIENLTDYDATITVVGGPTILGDVNVLIDLTTGFNGNVELILTHSNTSVLLSDFDDVDTVLFDDETFISISESFRTGGLGTFAPREPLSFFDGINSNGTWTLSGDGASTSTPTILNRWCLIFDEAPTPTPIPLDPTTNCNIIQGGSPIPDGGSLPSILTFSGPTFIRDVNLISLNINHPLSEQLTITLRSPEGTVVTLSSGNGTGIADVYELITLDDHASNPITGITALDSGRAFFPENALSAFNGEDATGDWTLTVTDTVVGVGTSGTLQGWCLQFDGGFSGMPE